MNAIPYDDFLLAGFKKTDRGSFGQKALQAARQIAKEESSEILPLKHESYPPGNFPDGWLPTNLNSGEESKIKLAHAIKEWKEKGKMTVFRGTSLPDARMGSFHLPDDGIHMAMDFNAACAYSNHTNPLHHNIFSLGGSEYSRLGFVTTWEVPLDSKVWSNFHYESYVNGYKPESEITVNDVMQELEDIAGLPAEDFELKIVEGHLNSSAATCKTADMFSQQYYEIIGGKEAKQTGIYLNTPGVNVIKIDPENPKWDKFMARVQEACLRDMYEVKPLENMIAKLEGLLQTCDYAVSQGGEDAKLWQWRGDAARKYLQSGYLQDKLEKVENREWQYESMADIRAADMPWVKNSSAIASASIGQVTYPPHIKQYINFSPEFADMDVFLRSWVNAIEVTEPLRQERKAIIDSREKLGEFTGRLLEDGSSGKAVSRGGECTPPVKRTSWSVSDPAQTK